MPHSSKVFLSEDRYGDIHRCGSSHREDLQHEAILGKHVFTCGDREICRGASVGVWVEAVKHQALFSLNGEALG